jgi:hypothetical protein
LGNSLAGEGGGRGSMITRTPLPIASILSWYLPIDTMKTMKICAPPRGSKASRRSRINIIRSETFIKKDREAITWDDANIGKLYIAISRTAYPIYWLAVFSWIATRARIGLNDASNLEQPDLQSGGPYLIVHLAIVILSTSSLSKEDSNGKSIKLCPW